MEEKEEEEERQVQWYDVNIPLHTTLLTTTSSSSSSSSSTNNERVKSEEQEYPKFEGTKREDRRRAKRQYVKEQHKQPTGTRIGKEGLIKTEIKMEGNDNKVQNVELEMKLAEMTADQQKIHLLYSKSKQLYYDAVTHFEKTRKKSQFFSSYQYYLLM